MSLNTEKNSVKYMESHFTKVIYSNLYTNEKIITCRVQTLQYPFI